MVLIVVALSLVLMCAILLVRRRASVHALLHFLSVAKDKGMPEKHKANESEACLRDIVALPVFPSIPGIFDSVSHK